MILETDIGISLDIDILEPGGLVKLVGSEGKKSPLASGCYMLKGQKLLTVVVKGIINSIIEGDELTLYHDKLNRKR